MSSIWQNVPYFKVLVTVFGWALILATSSPQTAEVANAYLAQSGYTNISIKAPEPYSGRGQKLFPFEARSNGGEYVAGKLSMGSFAYFYKIKLNTPQPSK